MNRFKRLCVETLSYLNYVPRYGRSYRLMPDGSLGPAEWNFRRMGYWGISLTPTAWLWEYVDTHDTWEEVGPPELYEDGSCLGCYDSGNRKDHRLEVRDAHDQTEEG